MIESKRKIIARENIGEAARRERETGKKVVFTNGCFDLLHPAHVRLFEFARAQGDFLVVGINSDASVQRLKGPRRPILPADERARILASLTAVDAVTFFDEDTPATVIAEIMPAVLVKGGDYGAGEIVGEDFVNARGGKTLRFPIIADVGTSHVVEDIVEKFGSMR